MIKSIRLQNFFGFQDCTVNLEPGANVLVGINGSGKSNFLKAVELLVEGIGKNNFKKTFFNGFGGFDSCLFYGAEDDIQIAVDMITSSVNSAFDCSYDLNISKYFGNTDYLFSEKLDFPKLKIREIFINNNGDVTIQKGRNKDESQPELRDSKESMLHEIKGIMPNQFLSRLLKIKNYKNFDTGSKSELRQPVIGTMEDVVSENGSTLPQVLNYIKNNNRQTFKLITSATNKVNSNFEDIEFQQVGGKIELRLVESRFNKTIPISNISDGTIRFLLLMTILYSPKKNSVICIDEPELGLHPDMINTLAEAIKYASKTSQLIISTHSAELLNHFDLGSIRVFEKDENNATVVQKYETEEFAEFMNKYMAGQLWRQGHLGGNRW